MTQSSSNSIARPQVPASASAGKDNPPPSRNDKRRWSLIVACTAALVVLTVAIGFFTRGRSQPPPLNADTVTLVKFVASDGYGKLNYDQQRQFMGVMEDREDNDELKNAFNAGKINEKEYRAALLEAWAGEQLKRAEKYARTNGEEAKLKYLSELTARKAKNKSTKPKGDDSAARSAAVKRDASLEDARMATLPPDVRQQWHQFRDAHSAAKASRDRVAESKPAR